MTVAQFTAKEKPTLFGAVMLQATHHASLVGITYPCPNRFIGRHNTLYPVFHPPGGRGTPFCHLTGTHGHIVRVTAETMVGVVPAGIYSRPFLEFACKELLHMDELTRLEVAMLFANCEQLFTQLPMQPTRGETVIMRTPPAMRRRFFGFPTFGI